MPQYVNSSTVGVDLNNASDTATHALGTKVLGSQDTMWVYVEAAQALSTGDCVTMTTGFTATRALTAAALTAANAQIAFPQTSATSGQFVWAAQHGNNMYIRISGTTSLSGVLYVAVSSGALHTTSASSTIAGVAMIANQSSTAVVHAVLANLTWPKFINPGQ